MPSKKTFEAELQELEGIVTRLEAGEVPLEEAISQFQEGMKLSKSLQATLKEAEETLVKVMQADGTEKDFD
jgi:exodeoxyribonuclease VII small subunit